LVGADDIPKNHQIIRAYLDDRIYLFDNVGNKIEEITD